MAYLGLAKLTFIETQNLSEPYALTYLNTIEPEIMYVEQRLTDINLAKNAREVKGSASTSRRDEVSHTANALSFWLSVSWQLFSSLFFFSSRSFFSSVVTKISSFHNDLCYRIC